MTSRILVAEDDRDIRMGLKDLLEGEGYRVELAEDGAVAMSLGLNQFFDLAILDIMMPVKNGFDVCIQLRAQKPDLAILMLTAKSEEIDKVAGLRSGADDYLTKPFGMYELLARVEALLRRVRRHRKDEQDEIATFDFGRAEVDAKQMRIRNGEASHPMTARELKLIQLFKAAPNDVLTRDFLLEQAWGVNYMGTTRTLDQHIAQLRKKIEPDSANPKTITTVHGLGYRFVEGR